MLVGLLLPKPCGNPTLMRLLRFPFLVPIRRERQCVTLEVGPVHFFKSPQYNTFCSLSLAIFSSEQCSISRMMASVSSPSTGAGFRTPFGPLVKRQGIPVWTSGRMCAKSYGSEFGGARSAECFSTLCRFLFGFRRLIHHCQKNLRFPCSDKKGDIRQQKMSENPSRNQCQENKGHCKFLNARA